ncbi:MAG: glycoside hydrolase family 2 TIM barrel-domain containing protein [Saprospiraceae bacterium]|nr:glycoside hydrolase family 2 TIM barrel-domain containing protein [Saprospiraceae bacterium]
MKSYYILSLFFYTSIAIIANAQERTVTNLYDGWKFYKGAQENGAALDLNDNNWQSVTVPHDWAIAGPFILDGDGNTGKLPWKGEGWYRRALDVPSSLSGKQIYLIFDGVMAFPKIYVNGKLAGEWDYGYNSFYVNITDFINPGEKNVLAVHADTRQHDSRWYPGAGIYRKVQMVVVNPVHVDVWGTYVTTPIVKPHYADVRIRTTINNFSKNTDTIKVLHQIISPESTIIANGEIAKNIIAGKSNDLETTITLLNPRRWDINDPSLYEIKTTVSIGGRVVDHYTTSFGVRTIRFDADHGFYLNDRRVQLKGVNMHHDQGPLGAAFYPRAMERQLEIMKEMGVNAIRNSHNVAAPELLELCDKMGLLVLDEIFDKYDAKADILESTDFEEFAHRNVRNFVIRDRNHPSIFLWSVGNEIGDVQWNINNGFQRLHTMLNYVNKYDPTRPTTLVNDNWQSAERRHFDYYDVHSYNYTRRYCLARQMEPNKAVIISESASTVSTRGFYEFPLPKQKTDFTKSLQVSSYDLNAPWWAEVPDDDFMWQQDEPYVAGEFVWTGFDYLGEPTPYDNYSIKRMGMTDRDASFSSYFGIVDLVGIPKDRFYLYKSYWKSEDTTIHILPHWNWEDKIGEKIPVFVYTNGDCAELFVNGKSQGMQCKQPKADSSVFRFRLMWNDIIYEPDELKVITYKEGKKLGEKVMKTAGKPAQIKLTADRKTIKAGGMDLSYVLVEAFDNQGNPAPLANDKINITLEGAGSIAGVGNGNPQAFEPFQANTVNLFYGKAMIIIKSGQKAGKVNIKVRAGGLKEDAVEITVQ